MPWFRKLSRLLSSPGCPFADFLRLSVIRDNPDARRFVRTGSFASWRGAIVLIHSPDGAVRPVAGHQFLAEEKANS